MPDEDGQSKADAQTLPKTSLHAYKEGREDDVDGDVEKLKAGRREDMNPDDLSEGHQTDERTQTR